MRPIIYCCLLLTLPFLASCSSPRAATVEKVPDGRSLWEFTEATVTKEQAKEIAVKEIRDQKPEARVANASAYLSLQGKRPMWNVSPSGLGDVSWQVTVDAISGKVTFAYVFPDR